MASYTNLQPKVIKQFQLAIPSNRIKKFAKIAPFFTLFLLVVSTHLLTQLIKRNTQQTPLNDKYTPTTPMKEIINGIMMAILRKDLSTEVPSPKLLGPRP